MYRPCHVIVVSIPPDPMSADLSRQTDRDAEMTSDRIASTWSYEATVRQVETIMARIESGELELADVFDQFADAVNYLRQCEHFLSKRQQQMDLLIETLTDEPE